MISLDQANQFRQQAGLTPLTSLSNPSAPATKSANDIIAQRKTALGIDTSAPAQTQGGNIVKDFAKNLTSTYGSTPGKIANDVSEGAKDIQNGNVAKGVIKTGARVAGDTAEAVFAPVSAAAGAATKSLRESFPSAAGVYDKAVDHVANFISDNPEVQKFAMEHPNAGEDFGRALNIVLAGKESGKIEPGTMVERTADQAKTGAEIAKNTATNIAQAVDQSTSVVTGLKNKVISPTNKVDSALDMIRPTMDKKETISAFENAGNPGGISEEGKLQTLKRAPTDRDREIADAVKDLVVNKKPVDTIVNINKAITDTSENDIGKYLEENKTPFNFEDLRKSFELVKPDSSLKSDPAVFNTYNRVRENILSSIYGDLKSMATKSGDFSSATDMNNLWDARKSIDDTISKELGDTTFGTPQYTGVKKAALDFRNAFSDFISDNLSNPGQMEKVNNMRDFVQTARSKGIDIPTDPETVQRIKDQFGITGGGEESAKVFEQNMDRLKKLYEARSNIAESNYKSLGSNSIKRWIKANPVKAKSLGWLAAGTLGGGIAHELGF